jgi:UDP-3-O-[3-hydroxymyristoyl] glucosamine N-acyltransferase
VKVKEIASLLQGKVVGDGEIEIERVAKIEEAGEGDITFLANPKYQRYLSTTAASAIIVPKTFDEAKVNGGSRRVALLKVDDPYLSFLQILQKLQPPIESQASGVHETAVIASSAVVDPTAAVGAHAVIGERVRVGANTKISHGTVVERDVVLGSDGVIYPNVTIRARCQIGNRVIIHSGAVIGSDGFGFVPKQDGTYEKIPQVGIVVVEDDVEIGANSTIDRATLGETRIGRGVKLDNLVHVAHNVVIGENTVIAAQTGISGSARIGKNVMMGGQVGLVGHIEVADNVKLMAQSGVSKSLTKAGGTYFGYPAKEYRIAYRIEAALRHLPELIEEIKNLRSRVEELEKKLDK